MTNHSESSLLPWLAQHAGFPHIRLETKAELLLCFAAAANREEAGGANPGGGIVRQDPKVAAAQRAHALRRSRVHYKSDNSAKV